MKNFEKPITVARADFIAELGNLINNSHLPIIILEPIFREMHRDMSMALDKQTENNRTIYNETLAQCYKEQMSESQEELVTQPERQKEPIAQPDEPELG